MGPWRLLGAGLVIGLGLDCAGAHRADERSSEQQRDRDDHVSAVASDAPRPAGTTTTTSARTEEPVARGTRYASLSHDACIAELGSRGIAYEALAPRLGIRSPVRLHGALSGVAFRTLWPEPERARTSFEIIDCRLVLALDDFAVLLRTRGIIDVMFFSAYRPPPAGWTERAATASRHRHEAGLAIDIGYFRRSDGSALNVEREFMPRSNERERICEPGPPAHDATPAAIELRKIACEGASLRLFHVTLTPAYDDVHRDHFHLELAPDKTDFVAR